MSSATRRRACGARRALADSTSIVHHAPPMGDANAANDRAHGFDNLVVIDHQVVQTKLTELRDVSADHREFRALLDEIAGLMVYEVTRDWPTKPHPIKTPLEEMSGRVLARQVTLVPILRAGLGIADG